MTGVFAMEIWSFTFLVLALGSASKFVDGMAAEGEKFEDKQRLTRESSETSEKPVIEKIPFLDDLSDRIDAINDRFAIIESKLDLKCASKCELEKRVAALEKNPPEPEPTDPLVDPITELKWSSILGGCVTPKEANGWTLLQQRDLKVENIFLTKKWNDYKNGFRWSGKAYWVGLQEMHEKTSKGIWEVALAVHCEGKIICTVYQDFQVESENAYFKLLLGAKVRETGGRDIFYLESIKNMPFSTIDRDNDKSQFNCAKSYGGWWHKNCYSGINPNGDSGTPKGCSRVYMAMKPLK